MSVDAQTTQDDAPDPANQTLDVPGLLAERQVLDLTMRAIKDNAYAWHAGEDGKARALNVIVVWANEAIEGRLHPSVLKIAQDAGWV